MTDRNAPVTGGMAAPAVSGGSGAGRVLVALVLAAIVAATVVFTLRHLDAAHSRWLLWAGAALAGLGLLSLLALVAGLLRLGGDRKGSTFLDALTSAIGHPLVVTDSDGRTVYANAAYRALASKSDRLVGLDVLFAPYAEFSAPVYQLSQAVAEGRSESRELRIAQYSSMLLESERALLAEARAALPQGHRQPAAAQAIAAAPAAAVVPAHAASSAAAAADSADLSYSDMPCLEPNALDTDPPAPDRAADPAPSATASRRAR